MLLKKLLTTIFILVISSSVGALTVSAQKLTPEELVTKHLAAIGTAEARGAIKTVINVGAAKAISRSSAVRDLEGGSQGATAVIPAGAACPVMLPTASVLRTSELAWKEHL